jgi:tetratricopeptide (TPR) repeat protein
MLKKSIPVMFILAGVCLLFWAIYAIKGQNIEQQQISIDQLKQQTLDYISQDKQIDANTSVKSLIANYTSDAKLPSVLWTVAEAYRNSSKFANAIELYKYIVDNPPTSNQAALAQSGIAISSVAIGNLEAAKLELEKLKIGYKSEPNISQLIFNVGDSYYWFGKFNDANSVYKYVVDKYPACDSALWATMGLAISSISNKDQNSADIYINKLSKEYAENAKLPEALYYIGTKYGYNRDYKKAISIYDDIKTKWPENTWRKNAEFETAKIGVFQYLDKNDEPNTLKAVDKLISDFNRPDLLPVVFDIAARSDWQSKYEPNNLTTQLYNRVIKQFPKSSQSDIAKICNLRNTAINFINISDDVNAFISVGTIIADFNTNPKSPEEIWRVAERYYGYAMRGIVKRQNKEIVADNFRKSILIKEKMVEELPASKYTPMALASMGLLYTQHLGEYKKGIEYLRFLINKWPDYGGLDNSYFLLGKYLEVLKTRGEVTAQEADLEIENSYKIILEKYPQSKALPYAAHRLGKIYYAKRDMTKATDYLLTAFNAAMNDKKCGEIVMMVNLLGQIYEKQGQKELAGQIYKTYVDWAEPNDVRTNPIKARMILMEGGAK